MQESSSHILGNIEIPKFDLAQVITFTEPIKETQIQSSKIQSAREHQYIKKDEIKLETGNCIEDQICIICCEKKADAVFMSCNHGGLCFSCANKIAEVHPVCHFCRKEFVQILKLDLEKSNTDFMKVLDVTNLQIKSKKDYKSSYTIHS